MRQRIRSFASCWLTCGVLVAAACDVGSPATPQPTRVDAAVPAVPFAGLTVYATSSNTAVAQSFFEFLPEAHATVVTRTDPTSAATADSGTNVRVALLTDMSCGECYRLSGGGLSYEVHGGNGLGAQYGLAQLLEELGFRFFHPWASKTPTTLNLPTASKNIGPTFTPAMTRRGLHLHTLHPIESYFTFWASNPNNGGGSPDAGGESALDGARRVIDWIVKNRGNYVEWSALNDIVSDDSDTLAAWRSHTSAIIAYAHERGIKIGIGTELFGEGNLQLSFDLIDDENDPNARASVDARWHLLTDGLAWDTVDISFGEFSGTDPNVFLTNLNLAYSELEAIAPGTELAATVHVGNEPSLEVTYDGQTLLYYFLVKYADPHIVPWIHTVMYFDLFQSVDGAYNMPSFDQHRAYLESRMKAGQPVAYYPESAYWIAFDDSVPTYLPVYMRSRWLDQTNLAGAAARGGYGGLKQSVLFSSGWEWGYWQNDYAVLRMNWRTPSTWTDSVSEMFAPWGTQGAQLAAEIGALGELESKYLIDEGLAAYVASQDELITLGALGGIVSQPPRTTFPQLAAMGAKDRASFKAAVLAPLTELDTAVSAVQAAVAGLNLDPTDPWLAETTDGIDIDAARVHFILSLYEAVAAFEDTGSDDGWLAKADAARATAETIVKRRDAHLHYPRPQQIVGPVQNSTYYQSGYLTEAATLCYWAREKAQARLIIVQDETAAPGCVP